MKTKTQCIRLRNWKEIPREKLTVLETSSERPFEYSEIANSNICFLVILMSIPKIKTVPSQNKKKLDTTLNFHESDTE